MTGLVNPDTLGAGPPDDIPLLRRPAIRWLFLVELAVMTVSQVWFVVLTWLLVERAATGATLGLVLMAGALPRAALMLVGGAVTDRLRPTTVLHAATIGLAVLLGIAAVLEVTGGAAIWQLLLLAASIGATDAFLFPAITSLLPRLVADHRLEAVNAGVQLVDQLTQLAGPALAGVLLTRSAGLALGVDAAVAAFAVLATVGLAARLGRAGLPLERQGRSHLWAQVREGLRFTRTQPQVRLGLVGAAGLSLVTVGLASVGGTLLAAERFGGPPSLGILLGGFGAGALVGVLIAARRPPRIGLRSMLVATFMTLGAGLALIGLLPTLWGATIVATLSAVAAGAAGVVVMAEVQRATPLDLQGRIASLIGFAFVALDPFSQGLAGLAAGAGPTAILVTAGGASAVLGAVLGRPDADLLWP